MLWPILISVADVPGPYFGCAIALADHRATTTTAPVTSFDIASSCSYGGSIGARLAPPHAEVAEPFRVPACSSGRKWLPYCSTCGERSDQSRRDFRKTWRNL